MQIFLQLSCILLPIPLLAERVVVLAWEPSITKKNEQKIAKDKLHIHNTFSANIPLKMKIFSKKSKKY